LIDILIKNISKNIIICCQSSKFTVNFAGFYWLLDSDIMINNNDGKPSSSQPVGDMIKLENDLINDGNDLSNDDFDLNINDDNDLINDKKPSNATIDCNPVMSLDKLMTYRIYPGINDKINTLDNDDVYQLLKGITNEINKNKNNPISIKYDSTVNNLSKSSNPTNPVKMALPPVIPRKFEVGELSKNILSHQLIQGLELLPTTSQSLLQWEKSSLNTQNTKNKSQIQQEKQKKKRKATTVYIDDKFEEEFRDDDDDDDDDENYSIASEIDLEEMKLEGWIFQYDSEFENSTYVGQKARKFFPKFGASDGSIMAYLPAIRNEGLELFHFLHSDQDKEDLEIHEVLKFIKYYKNNLAVDPENKNKNKKIKKSELGVECYSLEGEVLCQFASSSDAEYLLNQKPRTNIILKSCKDADYVPDCGVKFRFINSFDNISINNNNLKDLIKRISASLLEFKRNKKNAKINNNNENNAKSNSTFLKNNGKFNVRKVPMLGVKYQVNQENIPSVLDEEVIKFNRGVVNNNDDSDCLMWSLKWFDEKYIDNNGVLITNNDENLLELLLFKAKLAQIIPGLILRICHFPNKTTTSSNNVINEDDNDVNQSLSSISYSTIACVVEEQIQLSSSTPIEDQVVKLQVMGECLPTCVPLSQLKLNFCKYY
jgi:hypothetical protein